MVLDTTSGSRSVLGRAWAAMSLREYMVILDCIIYIRSRDTEIKEWSADHMLAVLL